MHSFRQPFLLSVRSLFTVAFVSGGLFLALAGQAQNMNSGYYIETSNGFFSHNTYGDRDQVKAREWRIYCYRPGFTPNPASTKGRWGTISGDSAQGVISELKKSQKGELDANEALGRGRVPSTGWTYFNWVGPIAVMGGSLHSSPAIQSIHSDTLRKLAEAAEMLHSSWEKYEKIKEAYEVLTNSENIVLETAGEVKEPNRFAHIGDVIKEYGKTLSEMLKRVAQFRQRMYTSNSMNINEFEGLLNAFDKDTYTLQSSIQTMMTQLEQGSTSPQHPAMESHSSLTAQDKVVVKFDNGSTAEWTLEQLAKNYFDATRDLELDAPKYRSMLGNPRYDQEGVKRMLDIIEKQGRNLPAYENAFTPENVGVVIDSIRDRMNYNHPPNNPGDFSDKEIYEKVISHLQDKFTRTPPAPNSSDTKNLEIAKQQFTQLYRQVRNLPTSTDYISNLSAAPVSLQKQYIKMLDSMDARDINSYIKPLAPNFKYRDVDKDVFTLREYKVHYYELILMFRDLHTSIVLSQAKPEGNKIVVSAVRTFTDGITPNGVAPRKSTDTWIKDNGNWVLQSIDEFDANASIKPASNASSQPVSKASPFTLMAKDATIHGSKAVLAQPGYIGWWYRPDDYVSWNIHVPATATYRIAISYSCQPDSAGSRYRFGVDGYPGVEGVVKSTGSWGSYIREYLGTIDLQAGDITLAVRITQGNGHSAMNLAFLSLEPVAR